jgi:hypothetical protein
MFLPSTTSLEFSIDAGTTGVSFAASAYDDTGSAITPQPSTGTSNGATAVSIVTAPASGHRIVKFVNLYNGDTIARTLTIRLDVSGTDRVLLVETLLPGERLTYTEDQGWVVVARSARNFAVNAYAVDFLKGGTAPEAAASFYCMLKDTGLPGAFVPGTPGLSGRVIDGTNEPGIPRFINPTTGAAYLQSFSAAASVISTMDLYDLLWVNTGLVVTTTTAQTVNSVAFPARDVLGQVNGRGCRMGILFTAAATNAAAIANTTITYTNSDGVPGRTATLQALVGLQIPATPVIGTTVWFQLQAGDDGVRSIESVTLGTSLVTGSVSLIVARKLDSVRLVVANVTGDGVQAAGGGKGPRLYDGTAFFLAYIASSTTASQVQATINVEEWS